MVKIEVEKMVCFFQVEKMGSPDHGYKQKASIQNVLNFRLMFKLLHELSVIPITTFIYLIIPQESFLSHLKVRFCFASGGLNVVLTVS